MSEPYDPTRRFSDRAADYVKFRPTYPAAAIDAAIAGLGEPAKIRLVDVGAGTGISARLLADRGCRVTAVEPNVEMMRSAAAHPGVTWVCAAAESTGLPSASADLVVCAQAFHWFRATEALDEFARVLRPGGRIVLLWNIRDERDPFSREYGELMIETATDASVGKDFQLDALASHSRFSAIEQLQVDGMPQQLDYDGLLGRATSSSYAPKSGPGFERLASGLKHAVERACDEHGFVQLRYVTQVFISHSR